MQTHSVPPFILYLLYVNQQNIQTIVVFILWFCLCLFYIICIEHFFFRLCTDFFFFLSISLSPFWIEKFIRLSYTIPGGKIVFIFCCKSSSLIYIMLHNVYCKHRKSKIYLLEIIFAVVFLHTIIINITAHFGFA